MKFHNEEHKARKTGNGMHAGSDFGPARTFRTVGFALAGTALCGLTMAQTFALNPEAVAETGNDKGTTTQSDANVNSATAYDHAKKANSKEESVYVFSKANGDVKNTTVSCELKNSKGAKTLRDKTELIDLQNTESDGEFATSTAGTVWDAQGDNVYYEGKTSKAAPVKVKVSYWLDGTEIAPDELAGKSGHVKIRFDYSNSSYQMRTVNGKSTRIYTPFLAVTGLMMDNDNFKNVKVVNGKAIDDGDRTMVGGYAMPGMQDNLDLSDDIDIDIPDYIEVEADAEDFDLGSTMTIVTSDIFDDADADELDLSKFDDAIDQLQDGMKQLINGSGDLTTGLVKLAKGADTLNTGSTKLQNGASTLAKGSKTLKTGTKQLADGTSELKDKTKDLPTSAKELNDGASALSSGLGDAKTGAHKLVAGLSGLKKGLADAQNGINQVVKGDGSATTPGISAIAKQLGSADTGDLEADLGSLGSDAGACATGIGKVSEILGDADMSDPEVAELVGKLSSALSNTGAAKAAGNVEGDITRVSGDATALKTQLGQLDAASKGLKQYAGALTAIANGGTLPTGVSTPGLAGAIAGIGSESDTEEETLLGGASNLSAGITTAATGAGQLSAGTATLNAAAPDLAKGVSDLDAGASKVNKGTIELNKGVSDLSAGTVSLAKGSKALDKGTRAALAGVKKLAKGIKTYNNKGIKKLVDAYNDNVAGISDRMDAIIETGRDYKNFSGITDGTEGHVKFIIETDSIGDSDE